MEPDHSNAVHWVGAGVDVEVIVLGASDLLGTTVVDPLGTLAATHHPFGAWKRESYGANAAGVSASHKLDCCSGEPVRIRQSGDHADLRLGFEPRPWDGLHMNGGAGGVERFVGAVLKGAPLWAPPRPTPPDGFERRLSRSKQARAGY